MNLFETILRDMILAGQIIGPIFIHSSQGVAILNASEQGLSAIVAAHQQQQAKK